MPRYAVIGLGRFGQELVHQLKRDRSNEVIALDRNIRPVEAIKQYADRAIRLDARHIEALREHDLGRVDAAIVCVADDLEANELAVIALKEMKVPLIVSRCATDTQSQILSAVGADVTTVPLTESARAIALRVTMPEGLRCLDLGGGQAVVYLPVFAGVESFALEKLALFREGVFVLGVERLQERRRAVQLRPAPTTLLSPGDVLLLAGPIDELRAAVGELLQGWIPAKT